jgi:iron complex outermembrane receptor protein
MMIDRTLLKLTGLILCSIPAALSAQAAAPPPPAGKAVRPAAADDGEDNMIEVIGRHLPGEVIGDIPAEVQLNAADIRSYGVSTISELLTELSPQTESGRGRGEAPVVLLNGKRISGMAEIRDIPTEAIRRVDIMPEEVALKYGYRADQKVVNFVLRPRFRATVGELEGGTATEGADHAREANLFLLKIRGDNRLNLGIRYQDNSKIQESDRDIMSATQTLPYDRIGNVTAPSSAVNNQADSCARPQIDPALSALSVPCVAVAGVPMAATTGRATLANFASRANSANVTDVSPYRSLLAASRSLSVNAVLSRPIGNDIQATFNANVGLTDSNSDQGLPGIALAVPAGNPFSPFTRTVQVDRYADGFDPNVQRIKGTTAHLGTTLNGGLGSWRWTVTGTYDRAETRTSTDRGLDITNLQNQINLGDPAINPFGQLPSALIGLRPADRARSRSDIGDLELLANGTLFSLPAGPVSGSAKIGGQISAFDARSDRNGVVATSSLSRNIGSGQVNIDLPITSARNNVLAALGDLSANVNLAADRISSFGTLKTIGYGTNWTPRKGISLIWSVTDDRGAPTVQQLNNPLVVTPDVRVFDYTRATTADITRISGGNAALTADHRHVTKFGITLKPLPKIDLTFIANYTRTRTRNLVASFPAATAAIEAAYPDRFTRDPSGQLLSIDSRPIQFAREDRQQLRWGFNFSRTIQSAADKIQEAQRAARRAAFERDNAGGGPDGQTPGSPPTTRNGGGNGANAGGPGGSGRGPGGGGPGGRFGGGGPGGGGARIQFALYHTWYFKDAILIRNGVPVLDLLNGAATGNNGGQPRHTVEMQAGGTFKGFGTRLSGNWQSGTSVSGGLMPGSTGDLRFSSLATLNWRLFANLGQVPKLGQKYPFLRGARIQLVVNNIFDTRQSVRDANGLTPLSYQPGYIDPIGRSVRIEFRKLFF